MGTSRSASIPSASCGIRALLPLASLASLMLWFGCGPSVGKLLRERHYEDAICAASYDGTGVSARRVGRALAQDLQAAIHVHPINPEELQRALGGRLRQDPQQLLRQFMFIRLIYSANEVPIRSFGLSVRAQAGSAPLRLLDFGSYEPLLTLTREPVPSQRTTMRDGSTEAVVKNIVFSPFLAIANLFTLPFGRAVYFRGGGARQVKLPLDDGDWARGAPDAFQLRQLFRPSSCAEPMTRPCQAFFAIERPGGTPEAERAVPVSLRFALSFGPLPIEDDTPTGPSCWLEIAHELTLPPGQPLMERLSERFGTQQRTFAELGASLSTDAELLRETR